MFAILVGFILLFSSVCKAYDISDALSIEATLTGVYQYADFNKETEKQEDVKDTAKGTGVVDLALNFHPTENDEFLFVISFASGNALNDVNPLSVGVYADDLEDDLKNINGRNRDYVLELWYKRTFRFDENTSLGFTLGILDAAGIIDVNAFADDEVTQFMNDMFVDNPVANLPSYDLGAMVELNVYNFNLIGLVMNTKNEEDKNYNYYALQLTYTLDTPLGEGNYRIYGFTTTEDFPGWDGKIDERLQGIGISFDQKLGKVLGAFIRTAWQDDDAQITHDSSYGIGININGILWGRSDDEIGIAYAYLDGEKKSGVDNTQVVEAYGRFKLFENKGITSDITLDFQYIRDDYEHTDDQYGYFYGVRWNVSF